MLSVKLHLDDNTLKMLQTILANCQDIRKRLMALQLQFQQEGTLVMATFKDLQDEVAKVTSIEQSAKQAIEGIAQQLKEALAQNDPVAIQKVIDDLEANTAPLATAIAANTTPTT